jgi:TM2 domain-containing membrane protein YozV
MKNKIFYTQENKQKGPVSLADLKLLADRGELKRTDKIWQSGMPGWLPADSLPAIFADMPPRDNPAPDVSPFAFQPAKAKSPGLMALFSFLLPGLGQICSGQDNKGVFLLGIALLGHWLTGGISSLLLCPTMSFDAFTIAAKAKRGCALRKWEFFPTIKRLNQLQPRVVPLVIFCITIAILLTRIVLYSRDGAGK